MLKLSVRFWKCNCLFNGNYIRERKEELCPKCGAKFSEKKSITILETVLRKKVHPLVRDAYLGSLNYTDLKSHDSIAILFQAVEYGELEYCFDNAFDPPVICFYPNSNDIEQIRQGKFTI